MPTILVIDDETKILEICHDYLVAAGFQVITAMDGLTGLALARREIPSLIVLDLMMPGMDGLEVCRILRQETNIPVIMLTARVEESDKLIGLELGADDYMTKPFSPRELVARVKAVLRRSDGTAASDTLRVNDMILDRTRYSVMLPGGEIPLTPTEFELLATLAAQPGRIFSRGQLLVATRGVTFETYERAIDSHIRNLRRKLEPPDGGPSCIVTVHGVGYKFQEG
jgi:two-component system, OmpR family, alkaline phosphatase synthesis response regulator PhoP